jgi:hypothetical protein
MGWLSRLLHGRSWQEMKGLRLADPQWRLTGLDEPARFFASLSLLVPADAYLFFEGGSHPAPLRELIAGHSVALPHRPALGTIWPATPYFSVPATASLLEALAVGSASLPYPEVCHHLHVFAGERVLVSGYDAFGDPFFVAGEVPEARVAAFCDAAGGIYERI